MALMSTNDGPGKTIASDTYATRTPGPETLEAMALALASQQAAEGRTQGVSLEEFQRGLLDCGFLDANGLREALAKTSPDERRSDVEGLARSLIRLGKLTRYQASALFQGKGKALLIGPYVVLAKLGSGGMGMVFKAKIRQGGPEIALKLLPPSASKHAHAVLRFRREAAILEKLDHPNIVSLHDIGEFNGVHYLVMDYVEGRDLDRVIRSGGPMKVTKAIDCVIQTARGLAAAHERGIVHRDIKPANLLLDTKGVVRILDLGLARITQADDDIEGETAGPSLTASGIIMGTVDFLPPEQSDDSKRADHRADIYSLGCTLYYLLTAKTPYSGDTIMQKLLAHHQKPIPSLIEVRPDVPPEMDALFRDMLAKSPDDRPQTMVEVLKRLEAWRDWNVGSKRLRVFGAPKVSKTEVRANDLKLPGESETYDLQTFVRSELLEPEPKDTFEGPEPVPKRKSKQARSLRRKADLALRWLVAAAAIAVLIRYFPKIPLELPMATKLAKQAAAPLVEVVPPKVEAPTPPPKPEIKAADSSPDGPLDDRRVGPPPPHGDGPPPPRPGEKRPPPPPKDGRPPRRPGEGPPPRHEDGSPNTPPPGSRMPF
jgi:serine/threonine protein kinase